MKRPLLLMLLIALLGGGCATPVSGPPRTISETLAAGDQAGRHAIQAYLVVDAAGMRLVDGLSLIANPPQPLTPPEQQIWLETTLPAEIEAGLYHAGPLRYLAVVAVEQLEGPGAFGPSNTYRYRMRNPQLSMLPTRETSIVNLLAQPEVYRAGMVRITGNILLHDDAAILVEELGPGGVPTAASREIKLIGATRDTALRRFLQSTAGGSISFGLVQVEGIWHDNALIIFSVLPVG
ncbi:MAG TPA: hypothetical protein PKA05_17250 [Roseiflexaceae bacterium]|nr:hypothetical protein [Roseiflexaceae bacterium]HMP42129.1 hypothetical protein [Roseiflexaceae bacterium]